MAPRALVLLLATCAGEPATPAQPAPSALPSAAGSAAEQTEDEDAGTAARCGLDMALVPGGRYQMPARQARVAVQPFCLDVHEATANEYATCLMAGKCTRARLDACNGPTIDFEGKGNHPIVCVDFAQAEAYCRFRDKRMPLDEEWEWAARGGDHGWQFPWGNDPPSHQLCWSGQSTRRQTCAVGSHPSGANPWGIEDLAGNVVEWTTTRDDPRIPERSGRGGSWKDGARALVRAARPAWFKPDYRAGFLGIRCATDS